MLWKVLQDFTNSLYCFWKAFNNKSPVCFFNYWPWLCLLCFRVLQNVADHRPKSHYILAVDRSMHTLQELVKVRDLIIILFFSDIFKVLKNTHFTKIVVPRSSWIILCNAIKNIFKYSESSLLWTKYIIWTWICRINSCSIIVNLRRNFT